MALETMKNEELQWGQWLSSTLVGVSASSSGVYAGHCSGRGAERQRGDYTNQKSKRSGSQYHLLREIYGISMLIYDNDIITIINRHKWEAHGSAPRGSCTWSVPVLATRRARQR
jgi:hypothetical protein